MEHDGYGYAEKEVETDLLETSEDGLWLFGMSDIGRGDFKATFMAPHDSVLYVECIDGLEDGSMLDPEELQDEVTTNKDLPF